MSCRPYDRCYSCQPCTVHWGHAVIALDATLNGWGEGSNMSERRWEDTLRPLLTSGHCCFTAVSGGANKYWTCELSWLPPLDSLQLSFHSWAVILSWKRSIYLRARNSLLPTWLRTFLCLSNERISILMISFIRCLLVLNYFCM